MGRPSSRHATQEITLPASCIVRVTSTIAPRNIAPLTQAKAPARAATHLESVRFSSQLGHQTRYSGPPRPEVDAAWDELLQNTNIRVSATDLRRIDRNSIPLADGSGDYMAGLDVYHQLHCVKYLRHYLYAEYYNTSGAGEPSVAEHVDHCLDSLRQVVMCGADVSLITYDWLDNYAAPYPNFDVVHQCRSFEAVDKWANQHALDVFDGTSLVHPVFGPAFARDEDGQPVKSELMHEHGVHSFGKVITPVLDGVQATRDSE